MRRIFLSVLAIICLVLPAGAKDAHPAYWTIHGSSGTVYLVSSLHLLPPRLDWHNPGIDRAMAAADSFVFEVPIGESEREEETRFIVDRGFLPEGEKLSAKLSDDGNRDFRRALHLAGMDQAVLDPKQPWLVEVVLTVQAMYRRKYSEAHTPEGDAMAFAARSGRDIRYFDTTAQQMEFLAGTNPDGSIDQFRAVLADFPNQAERESKFVEAWAAGDLATSASLVAAGFHNLPDEEQRLYARNRDWADQIGRMLNEKRTFFVAVGLAHLVGPNGLPALLRAKGIAVEGP